MIYLFHRYRNLLCLPFLFLMLLSCEKEEITPAADNSFTQSLKQVVDDNFSTYREVVSPNFNIDEYDSDIGQELIMLLAKNGVATQENILQNVEATQAMAKNALPVEATNIIEEAVSLEQAQKAFSKLATQLELKANTVGVDESEVKDFIVYYSLAQFLELEELDRTSARSKWRCAAAVFGTAISAGVIGCEVGGYIGGAAGTVTGPGAFATAAGGCVLGGMVGFIGGALSAIGTSACA